MGTRHLTCVVTDGQYKVAQYGQWDGYPAGQGKTVLEFLDQNPDLAAFRAKLQQCRFASEAEINALWVKCGADPDSDMVNMDVSDRFKEANPCLHRDTGAKVLALILAAEGEVLLKDDHEFAQSSLFCEWAYVIDLDRNTLEVYEGFNKTPVPEGERFAGLPGADGYQPVRLRASWPLNQLPHLDGFLATFDEAAA